MLKYILKRTATYIVMAFLATSAAFFMASVFFKPGQAYEARTPRPSQASVDRTLAGLGLDPHRPIILKYFDWLRGVFLHWDWGRTPTGGYVNHEFGTRVWVSARLVLAAVILTLLIGVALGVISASRQYSMTDRTLTTYSYITFILPAPVAYLLVQLGGIAINQAVGHRIFFVTGLYTTGITGFWPSLIDLIAHMIVPTFAMVVFGWGGYQTAQRQFLLDEVNSDFVRTARATGLTRAKAIRKHALRVSFIPVAQSIAFTIPAIFTGSFFAESIFNWPGVGLWSIQAIMNQDVSTATVMVAYGAMIFAVGAIAADIATSALDPRVRL